MSEFEIKRTWLTEGGKSSDFLNATFSTLTVQVNGQNVTAYNAEYEDGADHLEIPSYYLAEWIAENWWALLWEPRKNEDSVGDDDGDFLSRHSTLSAQSGFLLPQILFVSNGAYINIAAFARAVQFSDVRFVRSARAFVERNAVENVLQSFVQGTVDRLNSAGLSDTYLQSCWQSVLETEPEARAYCEMVGALGLSPYASIREIDAVLDDMCASVGETFTRDFCLVAKPEALKKTARTAKLAVVAMNAAPETNIRSVVRLPVPPDNPLTQAWQRGVKAANLLRCSLTIDDADKFGADRLFESLKLDPTTRAKIGDSDLQPEGADIVGAVQRDDDIARISFIQKYEPQRRFTAARAVFSAWASASKSGHLLTRAVTRHQQASRAFAAELLAPIAYLKKLASSNTMSSDDIREAAQELKVGADVVYNQAVNNGLIVQRA